ncbi:MAG TPA: polysaccharide lyase family protein, partial [Bryobacteraceae bacterium]|nr:polysaccharide lyase family protein [Bryobacteraceae bacterium]
MTRLNNLSLLMAFVPLICAQAQTRSVWQIGKFDQSPEGFAPRIIEPARFEVDKSDPEKDWPRSQGLDRPSTIMFPLDSVEGVYSLKIATLIDRPRVPALKISVNGHDGVFFLHPQLSYARSDFSFAFDPHESQSTLKIDLPTSFLKRGENTIVVACVDLPESSGDPAVSGISYDALSLEQDTTRKFDSKSVTANAEATIFYRQAQTGLSEVVDAFLRFNQPLRAGTVELAINGKRYTANLSTAGDYGEQRVSFEVPEWTGKVNAKLLVRAGDRRSFDVTLTPQRRWTIFIVPHTHLDVGYTDYQGKVAEVQPRVLNQAAELIKEHPDFRFSMDGSWNLQQLLDTRSKAKQEEIVNLIREGKMAMPAQYCNLLTGYASLETLYRSLYKSKELSQRYGLPFEYANITDVPTYSGSYPS